MVKNNKIMETRDKYWTYEERCDRCKKITIRVVQVDKKTDKTWENFRRIELNMKDNVRWQYCEHCECYTRNMLIAIEGRP